MVKHAASQFTKSQQIQSTVQRKLQLITGLSDYLKPKIKGNITRTRREMGKREEMSAQSSEILTSMKILLQN